MATITKFEEMESWKLGRELCQRIGTLIDEGRLRKNYGLIDQVEKSSGSCMDNIAEGFERGIRGEFITFLGYAKGSSGEIRSQLYRMLDRKYISQIEFDELIGLAVRISSMLQKFISYLQKSPIKGPRKK